MTTISIHTVLADCDLLDQLGLEEIVKISIHTVLADCDNGISVTANEGIISIHTVLADCDGQTLMVMPVIAEFQSTQSSQTVTPLRNEFLTDLIFQSTQSSQTVTSAK